MKKVFLFLAAMMTATVMNLHAAVPAGKGDFSVTFTTLDAQKCKLPLANEVGSNNDTVFIIGNFGSHPWQAKDGDDYMEFIGNAGNSQWLITTFSYPADFQFQFLIRYEYPDGSQTDVVVPSTPITFDGTTFSYQFTLCQPSAQITAAFDMQGHGEQVESQTIASGEKVERPDDPTADGYAFDGWFQEAACNNAFDFDKALTATQDTTITIYAKWVEVQSVKKSQFATGDEDGFEMNANIETTITPAGAISDGQLNYSGTLVINGKGSLIHGIKIVYEGGYMQCEGKDVPMDGSLFTLAKPAPSCTFSLPDEAPIRMISQEQALVTITSLEVIYEVIPPDMHDMLHFVSLKDNGTVKLNKSDAGLTATFEYSKDRINWNDYTWPDNSGTGGYAIALENAGDTVFFRAKGTNGKNATLGTGAFAYYQFVFGENDSIAAGGNAMSLYDAKCEQDTMTQYGLSKLFVQATQLVSAPKLPATQLAFRCYVAMFYGCSSLIQAPDLKATTLAGGCYNNMFCGCTSLQVDTISGNCNGAELVVPSPTTEPEEWNSDMFYDCKGAYTNVKLGGYYCIKEYVPYQIIVTYDLQGHGEAIKNDTIISGSKLTRPADPKAQGFEFRNWYTDAQSSGKAFDFSKAVTADKDTTITLYAKWRDSVAWEQFKVSLDKYSYVEYDTAYQAGFMIHLATSENAQVQKLTDMSYIEASEDVLANYDFTTWNKALIEEYTWASDELNKCLGIEEDAPIRRRPKQNYFLQLISAYTQLPYRVNGLNAVGGLFSSYVDLVYKAWLETNYEKDAELCKCMFNSDVFFKGNARIMAAFDACEK